MTKERKDTVTVVSAIAMLAFGCILTTIGFFLEPTGEVHDSVLWVLGQCFLYAGGALGIANYARTSARQEVDERLREMERHHRRPMRDGISQYTDNDNDGLEPAEDTEEDVDNG